MVAPGEGAGQVTVPEASAGGRLPADLAGSRADGATFHLGYRRWLDGLRGVAILLVLAFHLQLVVGGSLGVDLFFVLSGFLITSLLVEEWERAGSISLKRFYLRRALRLLPAFAVVLLACGIATLFLGPAEASVGRREILVAACYVSNWLTLHRTPMPTLGHTWSLSVEEQFYLLWPPLLCLMLWSKLARRWTLLLVVMGVIASAAWRIHLYSFHRIAGPEKSANILRLYMGLDTRADSLLVGCLAGLLAVWGLLPGSRRFVTWSGVLSLASAGGLGYLVLKRSLGHSQFYHGLFTAVALMAAIIIVRMLIAPSQLGSLLLENPLLVGTGRISYALYLFHIPVIRWLRLEPEDLGWRHPGNALLVLALTFAAAVLSYYLIERPCLRWKRRLGSAAVS